MKRLVMLLALVVVPAGARADVRLPVMFSDNMVVQRETTADVLGLGESRRENFRHGIVGRARRDHGDG